jgi:hypothetical protein
MRPDEALAGLDAGQGLIQARACPHGCGALRSREAEEPNGADYRRKGCVNEEAKSGR